MALLFNLLLLAAFSTHAVGGPVPRSHQRSQFTGYFNTTSTVFSVSEQKTVQADTAIVVEPIQETVFTSIAPAITFVNPDGQPLVTQDPQTVFSTSFITPTPKPTSDKSSSALSTSSTTPDPIQAPTGNSPLPTPSVASSALSSTVKAVENSTASETSRQIPKFTYSPAEKGTSTAASPTDVASEAPVPTSGGMPGFQHPGSAGPSLQPSNSGSSSAIVASSAASVVPSGSSVPSSRTRIIVTSYTTVYASASLPDAATTAPGAPGSESATATQTQQTSQSPQPSSKVTKQPTCSEGQEAVPSVTGSPAQALPSASLQVPPVVIVTSFTTVMASVDPSSVPQVPVTSAISEPVPTSSAVTSTSVTISSSAEPKSSAEPIRTTSLSPPESSTLAQPTSSSVPPPAQPSASPSTTTTRLASTSARPTPSSTPSPQAPASTSNATPSQSTPTTASSTSSPPPPPPPSEQTPSSSVSSSTSTSEGPLIITPIPPSQVFTVTETATKTEKETVRETVTVTAT